MDSASAAACCLACRRHFSAEVTLSWGGAAAVFCVKQLASPELEAEFLSDEAVAHQEFRHHGR